MTLRQPHTCKNGRIWVGLQPTRSRALSQVTDLEPTYLQMSALTSSYPLYLSRPRALAPGHWAGSAAGGAGPKVLHLSQLAQSQAQDASPSPSDSSLVEMGGACRETHKTAGGSRWWHDEHLSLKPLTALLTHCRTPLLRSTPELQPRPGCTSSTAHLPSSSPRAPLFLDSRFCLSQR